MIEKQEERKKKMKRIETPNLHKKAKIGEAWQWESHAIWSIREAWNHDKVSCKAHNTKDEKGRRSRCRCRWNAVELRRFDGLNNDWCEEGDDENGEAEIEEAQGETSYRLHVHRHKINVCKFFWIIISCTESIVAFSSVVSVALV